MNKGCLQKIFDKWQGPWVCVESQWPRKYVNILLQKRSMTIKKIIDIGSMKDYDYWQSVSIVSQSMTLKNTSLFFGKGLLTIDISSMTIDHVQEVNDHWQPIDEQISIVFLNNHNYPLQFSFFSFSPNMLIVFA